MLRMMHRPRPDSDIGSLEAVVMRAGAALACSFSNSSEFDAALIAARRAAGVYGPRRYRRRIPAILATLGTVLALAVFLFI